METYKASQGKPQPQTTDPATPGSRETAYWSGREQPHQEAGKLLRGAAENRHTSKQGEPLTSVAGSKAPQPPKWPDLVNAEEEKAVAESPVTAHQVVSLHPRCASQL